MLEIHFCGAAYRLGIAGHDQFPIAQWLNLNTHCSAFKLARESRSAGATLGRRFLRLVHGLVDSQILVAAIAAAQATESDTHHCAAFGLAGAVLGIDKESIL